jgi:hypothetical protein
MPFDDWAMAYADANSKLQITAGVTSNSAVVTNQSLEYEPGHEHLDPACQQQQRRVSRRRSASP